jgi:hypothetical protein
MAQDCDRPYCYRCKRQRTMRQLAFAFGTKGAPRYRCRDDRDCQDYQIKAGKYAEPS